MIGSLEWSQACKLPEGMDIMCSSVLESSADMELSSNHLHESIKLHAALYFGALARQYLKDAELNCAARMFLQPVCFQDWQPGAGREAGSRAAF